MFVCRCYAFKNGFLWGKRKLKLAAQLTCAISRGRPAALPVRAAGRGDLGFPSWSGVRRPHQRLAQRLPCAFPCPQGALTLAVFGTHRRPHTFGEVQSQSAGARGAKTACRAGGPTRPGPTREGVPGPSDFTGRARALRLLASFRRRSLDAFPVKPVGTKQALNGLIVVGISDE